MKNIKIAALVISGLLSGGVFAQDLTGTLKKIHDNGAITLGARESAAPFSYNLDGKQFVGYSVDIMMKVVDRIKTELKMPELKFKIMPFTAQNRIALIQNGTLDLECSTTTNNKERQQQVAFSNSIFVSSTKLITGKNSGIKDFTDLKGKNVATTTATTSERILIKLNEDKGYNMNIMGAKENGQAFLAVQAGRAVAFMMDDAILYGERAKSKNADDWIVVGTPQSLEAYGCMMRKGDEPFKKLVDSTIAELMKSGEINKIHNKWFEQPIPPRGLTLHFERSEQLKALYANPNDKAAE